MPIVNLKITHTELSDQIKDYLDKKMKPLMRFVRKEEKVHLELEAETKHKTGPKYRADITIMPNSEIYAQGRGASMQEAVDVCVGKLKTQLLKRKERITAKRKSR